MLRSEVDQGIEVFRRLFQDRWPRLSYTIWQPLDAMAHTVIVEVCDEKRAARGVVRLRGIWNREDAFRAVLDECERLVPRLLPWAGKLRRIATRPLRR